jgi:hypothetical protein
VGLIDSTWGGTPAEAWISLNGLSSDAGLMPVFAARGQLPGPLPEQQSAPKIVVGKFSPRYNLTLLS